MLINSIAETHIIACISYLGAAVQEQARQAFMAQIKKYVHVVLDASPHGDFFMRQWQQYPGIAKHCAVLWYQDWSQSALHAVCVKKLSQMETDSIQLDQALTELSVEIHNSVAAIADKFQQATRRQ